jgi:hypothetical protein
MIRWPWPIDSAGQWQFCGSVAGFLMRPGLMQSFSTARRWFWRPTL